jgi:hypothetical protein
MRLDFRGIESGRRLVYTLSMKRKLLLSLLVLSTFSACSTMRFGTSANSIAHIKEVDGGAEIARGSEGKWEAARIWENLRAGDRARTEAQGRINFSLGKYGGVLTLMPDSMITFEQLGTAAPDSKVVAIINLEQGRVVGDTLKLPPGTRIQIKTANGIHEIP